MRAASASITPVTVVRGAVARCLCLSRTAGRYRGEGAVLFTSRGAATYPSGAGERPVGRHRGRVMAVYVVCPSAARPTASVWCRQIISADASSKFRMGEIAGTRVVSALNNRQLGLFCRAEVPPWTS